MYPLFQSVIDMDKEVFKILNSTWTNPVLDLIMPTLTDLHRVSWLVKFVLPTGLVLWIAMERKKALFTILGIIFAVSLSDSICYRLIKENVKRDRPEQSGVEVRLLTHSHSGYSFPSIHASNIFAAAVILRFAYPFLRTFVYLIAMFVGYSRIYVGVHYPLDVIGGAIVGFFCAFFILHIATMMKPENWNYELPWFAKKDP